MKKTVYAVLIILSLAGVLQAQQGEYMRKSVSFVGNIWFGRNAQSYDFDTEFFNILVSHYIEDARFDFNELSMSSVHDFRSQANRLYDLDKERLGDILQETIGRDVVRVLSDPDIQKARREGLESESDWLRLAQLKGREFGLTGEQLAVLMNSAYLYLPYVSKIERTQKEKNLGYSIEGGILWYQVLVDASGEVSIKEVASGSTSGLGEATLGDKSYQKYQLGNDIYPVSERQYAQYSAMQTWIKNLTVIMKSIPEFCLSAQIVEKISAGKFSANLGKREGVHLDDGFFVNEIFEDMQGNQKTKRIGYARLIKNVDNRKDPELLSELRLFYGSRVMPGAVLQENPRLGLEIAFSLGLVSGLGLPANVLPNGSASDDIDSGIGLNMDLSYNLAPIFGITQTYWTTSVGFEFLAMPGNDDEHNPSIISVYSGLNKKMWLGRAALELGASLGVDLFGSETEIYNIKHETSVLCMGAKLGGRIVFLATPNVQLYAGIKRNFGFNLSSTYKMDDTETTYYVYDLDSVTLDRQQIELGFNWIVGSFPVNVFGWLDALKKY